ncbi:phosphodiester glycosidase family protein [Shimia sp.]|uniref:phosphodiester glycosidase family protein n=1 Tax=Shimia sp. TaxID=1954381 RepID=UPI003BAAB5BF
MRHWLCLAIIALPQWVGAVTCEDTSFEGKGITVCTVDATQDDLRLFLRDDEGAILGQFRAVERALDEGKTLAFAMNAGMYHADRSPVGHYVQSQNEEMRLLTGASVGNFGLLPNGVFCITENSARVYETLTFASQKPHCRDATQSGPMLVIDGALHPRFLKDSSSKFLRNGVGTSPDGKTAYFAISNTAVTFHEFGRFFRDVLKTPNALYFDGKISRLHAPQLDRSDAGFWMGPIVGVTAPAPPATE